jgi:hypothetical protein
MIFNKNEITSCIVMETITSKEKEYIENVFSRFFSNEPKSRVFNIKYLKKCPINSVIVKVQNPTKYMILYPFFSSHVSLPVKPGEHVWAFFPDGLGSNDIGYWMSRRATDQFIEDTNFTHNVRSIYKEYNNTLVSEDKNNSVKSYYNVNGRGAESYQSLLFNTEGNTQHVFEKVQRIPKKSSDLLLQGSNNTQMLFTNGKEPETATVLLTAGRGKTTETSADFIENAVGLLEANKASIISKIGNENIKEGHLDLLNDSVALVMSENPEFLNENSSLEYEFDSLSHFFARSDKFVAMARDSIYMETEHFKAEASSIVLGSGSQPYIRYDEFESLIKNIVSDINTLALQIAEINGSLYNLGASGIAASTGTPTAGLIPSFTALTSILSPPGSGDSEKVYNKTINKRLPEIQDCKSQKISGE